MGFIVFALFVYLLWVHYQLYKTRKVIGQSTTVINSNTEDFVTRLESLETRMLYLED